MEDTSVVVCEPRMCGLSRTSHNETLQQLVVRPKSETTTTSYCALISNHITGIRNETTDRNRFRDVTDLCYISIEKRMQ